MMSGESAPPVVEAAMSQTILMTATDIIKGKRRQDYGAPEDSFSTIARLWNTYLMQCRNGRINVTATDVAMMMVLFKVARTNDVPKVDSLVDICGYAALAGDTLTNY